MLPVSVRLLEDARRDLIVSLRTLRRNMGFAATAIASIALGVGATIAIFTIVDNLLLRPLPWPDANRLVMLWEQDAQRSRGEEHTCVSF